MPNPLPLTKLSETASKITLGWTPVPGAIGYRFQSATQAPKWSHTFDPARSQVTFSKAEWYVVEALGVEAAGRFPAVEPPPPPPPPPPPDAWPASFKTGPAGQGNILPPKKGVLLGAASDDVDLSTLEGLCGRKLDLEHRYMQQGQIVTADIAAAAGRGHIPLVSFLPVPRNGGRILRGEADANLIAAGRAIAAQPHKILLRIYWEFNGGWYDFSKDVDGGWLTTDEFKQMWRRTVDKLREGGAFPKASIVWCPSEGYFNRPASGGIDAKNAYPGDDYVDWVGSDSYNHGSSGWRNFAQTFGFGTQAIQTESYYRGRKPYLIGETSSIEKSGDPNGKGNWWRGGRDFLKSTMTGCHGMCVFDVHYTDANWRVDTSPGSVAGFKELAQDPYFNTRA